MKIELNKSLDEGVRTLMKLEYEPIFWNDNKAELVKSLDKQGRFHCKMKSDGMAIILDLHEDRIIMGYHFSSSDSELVKKECQRIQKYLE